MAAAPLTFTAQARVLGLTGLAGWLLACACQVWEVLASQSPGSPLHFGLLPGPVAQLRGHCFEFGVLCVGLAVLWSLFQLERGWLLVGALLLGGAIETAALTWAAARGMLAVQAFDPRADARLAFYARALGHGLTLLTLTAFFVQGLLSARRGPLVRTLAPPP